MQHLMKRLAMDTLPSSSHLFMSFLLSLLFLAVPSFSADPDPLQDFCVANLAASPSINGFPCKSSVTSEDFFFSGLTRPGNTSNPNGLAVIRGDVLAFPGLNTLGLSININVLAPGGINPPHVHPRASEAAVVLEGAVHIGFITTNNTLFSKVVNPGEMFVVPTGLVHFQLNVGRVKARVLSAFNSQLPGISSIPINLFGSKPTIPNEVLTKGFRMDNPTVKIIKSRFAM